MTNFKRTLINTIKFFKKLGKQYIPPKSQSPDFKSRVQNEEKQLVRARRSIPITLTSLPP